MAYLVIDTRGTGDDKAIFGLPFTATGGGIDVGDSAITVGRYSSSATSIVQLLAAIGNGSVFITLYPLAAASTANGTASFFGNSATILVSGFYRTAA